MASTESEIRTRLDSQSEAIRSVVASGNISVAHWLSRARGTLKNGHEVGSWVRATSCSQRGDHGWLITHEHISLPVSPVGGSAAVDLAP
jgi:ketosteroid isomerase-like protein